MLLVKEAFRKGHTDTKRIPKLPTHPLTETPVRGLRHVSKIKDEPKAW
jgi:hypothetical protein